MRSQLIQRLARAGLLTNRQRADLWLRHRVDHDTRRALIADLFSEDADAARA